MTFDPTMSRIGVVAGEGRYLTVTPVERAMFRLRCVTHRARGDAGPGTPEAGG